MPKSIYENIFKDLKTKIEGQFYTTGSILPSENDLIQVYDCSRNTVRRAIAKLTNLGYTQPIHGKGVRIIYAPLKSKKTQEMGISSIEGLNHAATKSGYKVKNKVLVFTELTVDKRIARRSGFEENTQVYFIQRLRSLDNVPKMIDSTLLRKDLVPGLTKEKLKGSLFSYIQNEVGMQIQTVKRCITIERTTPVDEKYLTLDGYNCLAVISSRTYNSDGIQFEYTESRNRPDIFVFNTVASKND